jgi:DNA-binding MarR family transcriptional regulator
MDNDAVLVSRLCKHCGRIIDRRINRMLKNYSIARSQYRVLHFTKRLGQPTQKELVEALGIRGPTLTPIVGKMVKKGWLAEIEDKSDKRIKRHSLTPSGKQLYASIPEPSQELEKLFKQVLNPDEVAKLEDMLKRIIKELTTRQV